MIEALETEVPGKTMVYVTVDEKNVLDRLFRIKMPSGYYTDSKDKGRPVAYHWLLNPITVKRRLPGLPTHRLPSE